MTANALISRALALYSKTVPSWVPLTSINLEQLRISAYLLERPAKDVCELEDALRTFRSKSEAWSFDDRYPIGRFLELALLRAQQEFGRALLLELGLSLPW